VIATFTAVNPGNNHMKTRILGAVGGARAARDQRRPPIKVALQKSRRFISIASLPGARARRWSSILYCSRLVANRYRPGWTFSKADYRRYPGEICCRSRRHPRRHAQTDREPDGTRSVCAEKASIPDGAHVLRDAELLRYISAIFFDIHLREV
jgi:hypothetical protein